MKLLISTKETQGQRPNDFCYTNPGELVVPGFECDSEHGDPDGVCGCARAMCGLQTRKGTTTAKVEDVHMDVRSFTNLVLFSHNQAGFTTLTRTDCEQTVKALLTAIEPFPVGAVLEYRAGNFAERGREGVNA
jgi:hypothetical protein